MQREGVHDLAAGYALGVLDDDERHAFDAHLETCPECRDEIASLTDAAAALAYAAEGPPPPAALKGRILEAARAERRVVVPLRPRRRTVWIASAAAAACLALGLGLWAGLGTGSSPGARRVALQGARGTLQVSRSGDAVLTVQDVGPAPVGKTYEVWVIHGKMPAPAGLFQGSGTQDVVRVGRKVRPGETVAVTLEHAGGVSAPTRKPLFLATLPA